MITKDEAMALTYRQTLYSSKFSNADGSPARCRVNGRIKTWKRDPERWRLPVKHGLRFCFYLDHGPMSAHWHLTEDAAIAERQQTGKG